MPVSCVARRLDDEARVLACSMCSSIRAGEIPLAACKACVVKEAEILLAAEWGGEVGALASSATVTFLACSRSAALMARGRTAQFLVARAGPEAIAKARRSRN